MQRNSPDEPMRIWRVYHAIRRKALFENRGRFGVYNENHSDEFEDEQTQNPARVRLEKS
jgi:hypothetical protein